MDNSATRDALVVSDLADILDLDLSDVSGLADAEVARAVERIVPAEPDARQTSVSAFNSSI
jgi:FXSXX-COOH protein